MFKRDIIFPGQYKGEKVVLLLRRHWLILGGRVLKLVIVVAIFAVLYILATIYLPGILDSDYYPLVIIFFIGFLFFVWAYFFEVWNDYYLDVWIVTTERIINIEQEGLFKRVASEQKIYRVQDVTTKINGVIPTMLDYGDVHIQTAGAKQRFVFEQVPHPYEIKKVILDLHDKFLKKHGDKVLRAENPGEVAEISKLQNDSEESKK